MEVKLSAETLEVLNYFQRIGQMIKFKKDNDWISIVGGETIATADISEEFPRDVNIYDLNELMAIFNVVKEPTLDLTEDNIITIKADGLQLRYIEGEGSNIKSVKNKPTLASMPSVDVKLSLTLENIKKMNSLISTLKLPYVAFVGEEGKIYFKGFNKNVDSDKNEMNSCKILLCDNETEFDSFAVVFSRETLSYLTNDCEVYLSKHFINMFDFGNRQVFITADKTLSSF